MISPRADGVDFSPIGKVLELTLGENLGRYSDKGTRY